MIRALYGPFRALSLIGVFGILSGVLAFVAQALLARTWSASDYGAFATAYATMAVLAPLGAFGVGLWWLQVFAQEGRAATRWLAPSYRFIAFTSAGAVLLVLLWALLGVEGLARALVLLLATGILLHVAVDLLKARFLLEERYNAVALIQSLPSTGKMVVALAAVGLGFGPVRASTLFALFSISVSLIGVASLVSLYRHGPRLGGDVPSRPGPVTAEVAAVGRATLPFGVGGLLYMVLYQSDIVVLGNMESARSAAVYTVCVTFISAFYLFPSTVFQKYLIPKLHRWAYHDRARFLATYRFGTTAMALMGSLVCAGVLLVGPQLVALMFGPQYSATRPLLSVLALALPIRYVAASVGSALTASGHMMSKAKIQGAAALANVVLNVMFIPRFGVYAAATTTVLCELGQLVLFMVVVRRHVFGADGMRGWNLRPGSIMGARSDDG